MDRIDREWIWLLLGLALALASSFSEERREGEEESSHPHQTPDQTFSECFLPCDPSGTKILLRSSKRQHQNTLSNLQSPKRTTNRTTPNEHPLWYNTLSTNPLAVRCLLIRQSITSISIREQYPAFIRGSAKEWELRTRRDKIRCKILTTLTGRWG